MSLEELDNFLKERGIPVLGSIEASDLLKTLLGTEPADEFGRMKLMSLRNELYNTLNSVVGNISNAKNNIDYKSLVNKIIGIPEKWVEVDKISSIRENTIEQASKISDKIQSSLDEIDIESIKMAMDPTAELEKRKKEFVNAIFSDDFAETAKNIFQPSVEKTSKEKLEDIDKGNAASTSKISSPILENLKESLSLNIVNSSQFSVFSEKLDSILRNLRSILFLTADQNTLLENFKGGVSDASPSKEKLSLTQTTIDEAKLRAIAFKSGISGKKLNEFFNLVLERKKEIDPYSKQLILGKGGSQKITLDDKSIFDIVAQLDLSRRQESKLIKSIFETLEDSNLKLGTIAGGLTGGWISTLLTGATALLLVAMFWDKVKPFLEKYTGVDLSGLGRYEGSVEATAKFGFLGASKLAGMTRIGGFLGRLITAPLRAIGRGILGKEAADALEGGIKSAKAASAGAKAASAAGEVGQTLLPFADEALEGGARLATSGAGEKGILTLLSKLSGSLFKGLGVSFFKGLPVIGALISWWFAWDRWEKGDYIGSVIDIVGGLTNLIPGPIGIGLSLGAAALNAFLDFKFGGENENQKKLTFFGDLGKGIYNSLIKIPGIGGLVESLFGFYEVLQGIINGDLSGSKKGLEMMSKFPILGLAPAILLSILDIAAPESGSQASLTTSGFLQAFKQRVGKSVLSWFSWMPSSWQKLIAETMGVVYSDGSVTVDGETMTLEEFNKSSFNPLNKKATVTAYGQTMTLEEWEKSPLNPLNKVPPLESVEAKTMSLEQTVSSLPTPSAISIKDAIERRKQESAFRLSEDSVAALANAMSQRSEKETSPLSSGGVSVDTSMSGGRDEIKTYRRQHSSRNYSNSYRN